MRAQIKPAALEAKVCERGIELSKAGLHRLETTEPKNPNLRIVEAIAEITHVSPGCTLFGKGSSMSATEAGPVMRSRVIDTIELLAGSLSLMTSQELADDFAEVVAQLPRRSAEPGVPPSAKALTCTWWQVSAAR